MVEFKLVQFLQLNGQPVNVQSVNVQLREFQQFHGRTVDHQQHPRAEHVLAEFRVDVQHRWRDDLAEFHVAEFQFFQLDSIQHEHEFDGRLDQFGDLEFNGRPEHLQSVHSRPVNEQPVQQLYGRRQHHGRAVDQFAEFVR